MTTVKAGSVEAGSYHTLGLELWGGDGTILVQGRYEGTPFTYQSSMNPDLAFPLSPKVNVLANGGAGMGVLFDVAAWFTADDGSIIDPTNPDNHWAIENRILASMAAHSQIEAADGPDDDD